MLLARENTNLATEGIRSKAKAHDESVDRLVTNTTSLYLATQDKILQDAEVAEMDSGLVRMHNQLNESTLASEALKEELLDRNTEIMDEQAQNHLLNGMQINYELQRALDDQQESECDIQSRLANADKGRGKWKVEMD
jgi:hypothetical protein